MFSELRNNQHRRNGDCAATDRLRNCNNAAGKGDNSTEIDRDRQYHRKSDPMLNSVLNGNWSNSVPGRQFPKGPLLDSDIVMSYHLNA